MIALKAWKQAKSKRKEWQDYAERLEAERFQDRVRRLFAAARARLMPKPEESLAQWMERCLWLPSEVTVETGRVHLYAYQRGIADAMSDPGIERVSVIKSARTGLTTMIVGAMGYRADRAGGNMLMVQPTVHDAEGFGRDQLIPTIRASPTLNNLFPPERSRDKSQTLRRKEYQGGTLYLVGANSGTGFRRILAPWILLDEVDAYPASAGDDGDPVKLAEQRGVTAWDRKIIAASTPLVAKHSRIEALFLQGDQRRYFVPCPHCGHMDFLVFRKGDEQPGHSMEFPEDDPGAAYFECGAGGCVITEDSKAAMIEAGEWRATAESQGSEKHASFHIWAAYSPHPKNRWGLIAEEYVAAKKGGAHELQPFFNTVLGQTWKESGDAPDWELLYARRERYPIGTVPEGAITLVCGLDVAPVKGRIDYEVVAYAENKRSWSVTAGSFYGPITEGSPIWAKVDALIGRSYPREGGGEMVIRRTAIDSGAATNVVYNWARRYGTDRVITVKGKDTPYAIVSVGRPVDVTVSGKMLKGGHRLFIVGASVCKQELYDWLKLKRPEEGDEYPAGWCHFPEYDEEFFRQMTAEHLVSEPDKKGFPRWVWKKIPGRENHFLDCRVYARAAVASLGLDRLAKPAAASGQPAPAKPTTSTPRSKPTGWLGGRSGRARKGAKWLSKR